MSAESPHLEDPDPQAFEIVGARRAGEVQDEVQLAVYFDELSDIVADEFEAPIVAVVGDVLASLLEKTGYDVTREFYINDAGAQVDHLARSVYLRYREACGETIGDIPEGLYPGDYLKLVGEMFAA